MTLVDLIKSVIDASKDRLKSPISGAFICSFTIYNWRPIAVLLFSNAPLEDRIVVINHAYCSPWAIIIPLIIAFVYTLGIPKLMVWIDKVLSSTKKARLDDIYASKTYEVDLKTKLASKILALKNAESGNMQISELQEQIKMLQDSNTQIINANKITVDQLNAKLKEYNEIISNYVNDEANNSNNASINSATRNQRRVEEDYINEIVLNKFSIYDKEKIKKALKGNELVFPLGSKDLLARIISFNVATEINGKIILTELGRRFVSLI